MFVIFTPNPEEMIRFDDRIFQMGWNHQRKGAMNRAIGASIKSRQGFDQHILASVEILQKTHWVPYYDERWLVDTPWIFNMAAQNDCW